MGVIDVVKPGKLWGGRGGQELAPWEQGKFSSYNTRYYVELANGSAGQTLHARCHTWCQPKLQKPHDCTL